MEEDENVGGRRVRRRKASLAAMVEAKRLPTVRLRPRGGCAKASRPPLKAPQMLCLRDRAEAARPLAAHMPQAGRLRGVVTPTPMICMRVQVICTHMMKLGLSTHPITEKVLLSAPLRWGASIWSHLIGAFSLSKDADFAANMEEPEMVGYMLDGALPGGEMIDTGLNPVLIRNEPFLPPMANEERALVLYKPVYANIDRSLIINPELVTELKNFAFWPGNGNVANEMFVEDGQSSSTGCLAVVPWVPPQADQSTPRMEASTLGALTLEEPMEEEAAATSMEIEDEGFHQVPQHCMAPELQPTAAPTPITW